MIQLWNANNLTPMVRINLFTYFTQGQDACYVRRNGAAPGGKQLNHDA